VYLELEKLVRQSVGLLLLDLLFPSMATAIAAHLRR
jgi:hypothetical protein